MMSLNFTKAIITSAKTLLQHESTNENKVRFILANVTFCSEKKLAIGRSDS